MGIRMGKKKYITTIIVVFLIILIGQFLYSLSINIKPPSDKWSKEVKISEGKISDTPEIIKIDQNYLVVHDHGDKIKAILIDKLGNKLQEKEFKCGSDSSRNALVYKNKNEYYLSWIVIKNEKSIKVTVHLDKNLNEIKRWEEEGVRYSYLIGENIILDEYGNYSEVINYNKGTSIKIKHDNSSLVFGTTNEDASYIVYLLSDGNIVYNVIEEGQLQPTKKAGSVVKTDNDIYVNGAVNIDGNKGYILIERRRKNQFKEMKKITFSLGQNNEEENENLEINNMDYIHGTQTIFNEPSSFLATVKREYNKKYVQDDIVEFKINDGVVREYSLVSKSRNLSIYPTKYKNIILFCNYINEEKSGVFIASSDNEFKAEANKISKADIGNSIIETIQGLLYSFAFIFVIALKWLFFGFAVMGVISFFDYKFEPKTKLKLFSIVYFLTAIYKAYVLHGVMYVRYIYYLPKLLTSPLIGLSLSLLISLIAFTGGYSALKRNLDGIPVGYYMMSLIFDTILTLFIFVPFI